MTTAHGSGFWACRDTPMLNDAKPDLVATK